MIKLIGEKLRSLLNKGTWTRFPTMFIFDIMVTSSESEAITPHLYLWLGRCSFIGARLELVNRKNRGKKRDLTHIAKILAPNFGVGTEVRRLLSSTNFVEESMSPTCYGGRIVIRSTWRLKEVPFHFVLRRSGSPQTSTLARGTPMSTQTQLTH